MEKSAHALTRWLLTFGVVVYLTFYAFESPIRYQLNIMGLDNLIFVRDATLFLVLAYIFARQFLTDRVSWAFWFYLFIVGLHGSILMINIGSFPAVVLATKMLMSMLFGALAAPVLFMPGQRLKIFYAVLWAVTLIGVWLHKYDLVIFPWSGMTTKIGGVEVFINRDWTLTSGFIKRAAGFTRSSINAANLLPPLALLLMFSSRSILIRTIIAALTLVALYWTTQKGALLSFAFICLIMTFSFGRLVAMLRLWLMAAIVLVVVVPVVLPGYIMPSASGQFSMSSFYERVEWMWPETWNWLRFNDAFPFGVGLGGIGAAQNMYDSSLLPDSNAADNLFVFMYLTFGMMSFVYLGWLVRQFIFIRRDAPTYAVHAMAVIAFIIGYGVFLSMFEDMMATLFGGAALVILYNEAQRGKEAITAQSLPVLMAPTPPDFELEK